MQRKDNNNHKGQEIRDEADIKYDGKLLSAQERDVCLRIAVEDGINSQRATALLAIDDGVTHVEASQRAGLTLGQVKYWLGKFRNVHLDIFPEITIQNAVSDPAFSQAKTSKDSLSSESSRKSGKSKSKKSKKGKSKVKTKKKKPKKKGGKKQKKKRKKSM